MSKELHALYKTFQEALTDPKTPPELQSLSEESDALYREFAHWLLHYQINAIYKEFSAIQERLRSTPNDTHDFKALLELLDKIKTLEATIESSAVDHAPMNALLKLKEALHKEIDKEMRAIYQKLDKETLHKDASHYSQSLKTGKARLAMLKGLDPSLKTPQLSKAEIRLRQQIKRAQTLTTLGDHLSFSMGEFSTRQAHSTVKKLYKRKGSKMPKLLQKTRFYARKDEIQFLQQLVHLLENEDHLPKTKKAAILLGALNYLDKKQATYFTVGVNHLKKILSEMRSNVFSELKNTSPTTYAGLKKDSKNALRAFLSVHQDAFKNNATASTFLREHTLVMSHSITPKKGTATPPIPRSDIPIRPRDRDKPMG
jgi:hypothetical protein